MTYTLGSYSKLLFVIIRCFVEKITFEIDIETKKLQLCKKLGIDFFTKFKDKDMDKAKQSKYFLSYKLL